MMLMLKKTLKMPFAAYRSPVGGFGGKYRQGTFDPPEQAAHDQVGGLEQDSKRSAI